jgi:hypothetical protein
VSSSGSRLLGEDAVAAMQEPRYDIPSIDGRGDAIGLGWRLNRWGGRRVFGHDGGTIGQLAYLRVQPDERLAVCLLTNASVSDALYHELFTEIFSEYAGIAPPSPPQPSDVVPVGLERHVGRYERGSRRYDVSLPATTLHVRSMMMGNLEALDDEGPEEFDLHPVDSSGDRFVCRTYPAEPWNPVLFGALPHGRRYVYAGGRITPLVS